MKRLCFIVLIGFTLTVVVSGCKKKEEQPIPRVGSAPNAAAPMPPQASPHGNIKSKVERKVVVPNSVKAEWVSVKFAFEDKTTKKMSEYSVKIGSDFNLPGSSLKISVGEFLPDFKITENETVITSGSNEPKNPAVRVEVFENGKSIFKGWLYSKFPAVPPFEHQRYGLSLKEGLKK
ncbi:MAG: DUF2155 domain-containing protein [Nitrospirae bacterium]|nr:DUF2155 domain-containing protein [Nitrospirota bacterium]